VKRISARAALIPLFLGFNMINQGQAEDYYIYQTPNGALVISNKGPAPGSKIRKRISFPDALDNEAPQNQSTNKPQPSGPTEQVTSTHLRWRVVPRLLC
jgi:hypothetical protein